jgi:prepilin-type N-terminal cleavage/methylation domain-containing protein/prepilin-type processing-associated H-X9-DG protein
METAKPEQAAGSCPRRSARNAVTLVELLVVVSIISLLMALLLPALNSAREASRRTACQNNLRQFGIGMHEHAGRFNGLFCSGAFDWLADGSVTEIGWVADLVNKGTPVGKMLCPSNAAQLAVTYNDLLTATIPAGGFDNTCVNKLGSGPVTLPDATLQYNPCDKIINSDHAAGKSRADIVGEEILQKHYNTNYTASWFLVRSGVALDEKGNFIASPSTCPKGVASRNSTYGSLNQAYADSSGTPLSIVPLLGCGATAGTLAESVGSHSAGTPLAASFTGGPVQVSTDAAKDMEPLADCGDCTRAVWWGNWNKTLQDYRGFGAVHRGVCNVLFADGSVNTLIDSNNDGLINNGFSGTAKNGFGSDVLDVQPEDMVGRWSLRTR